MDRPGHYVYLRDDENKDYWSISWQPVGKQLDKANYTCRHGMSYSVYECDYNGIFFPSDSYGQPEFPDEYVCIRFFL